MVEGRGKKMRLIQVKERQVKVKKEKLADGTIRITETPVLKPSEGVRYGKTGEKSW